MEILSSMYALPAYFFAGSIFIARASTGSWQSPAVFIMGTYLLSGLATLMLDPGNLAGFKFDHSWVMIAAFIAIILVSALPSLAIRRPAAVDLFDNLVVRGVLLALAPLAWYSALYQLPYAILSLGQGAETTRHILNVEKTSSLPVSYFTTVAVGISFFYPLYTLALIEGIARKRNPLFLVSCFVGSVAYVINGICFTARDAFIWFVLTYIYAYWVYGRLLGSQARTFLKVMIWALAYACVAGLALFTLQRFAQNNALESVYSYLGQQPYVFAETVAEQRYFYGLSLRFPLVAEALGTHEEIVRTIPYEWSFGGFAKDFYAVSGTNSAVVLTALFAAGSWLAIVATRRQTSPAHLLICYLYFQFMAQGMFYFRLGSESGNQYYLLMFLLIIGAQVFAGNRPPPPTSMTR